MFDHRHWLAGMAGTAWLTPTLRPCAPPSVMLASLAVEHRYGVAGPLTASL